MVSQLRRDAVGSRARLWAAAAEEFAARGFAGATVDRIAARARVTKAMVYYHFASKAALYREILRAFFAAVASRVVDVRAAGGPPDAQLGAFIRAINETALAEPRFPPIWLREVADGGRHLDETIVRQLTRVLATLADILAEGRSAGAFRDVPPLIVQFGIVGPLLLAAATEPIRDRTVRESSTTRRGRRVRGAGQAERPLLPIPPVSRDAMAEHVQRMTLAALRPLDSKTLQRQPFRRQP
jgi:TetR/AcrR family transcriptional regulator